MAPSWYPHQSTHIFCLISSAFFFFVLRPHKIFHLSNKLQRIDLRERRREEKKKAFVSQWGIRKKCILSDIWEYWGILFQHTPYHAHFMGYTSFNICFFFPPNSTRKFLFEWDLVTNYCFIQAISSFATEAKNELPRMKFKCRFKRSLHRFDWFQRHKSGGGVIKSKRVWIDVFFLFLTQSCITIAAIRERRSSKSKIEH